MFVPGISLQTKLGENPSRDGRNSGEGLKGLKTHEYAAHCGDGARGRWGGGGRAARGGGGCRRGACGRAPAGRRSELRGEGGAGARPDRACGLGGGVAAAPALRADVARALGGRRRGGQAAH